MARVFIGVGSNIDPERSVREALQILSRETQVKAISMFYCTEPLEHPEQPPFYNGIVELETDLTPEVLKASVLRVIEKRLGRRRSDDRYAARTIDLDIVVYNNLQFREDEIASRPFIAVPLAELAPELRLPGSGLTVGQMAIRFAENDMQPLPELTELLRKDLVDGS